MSENPTLPRPDCDHHVSYRLIRTDGVMLTICAMCHEVLATSHTNIEGVSARGHHS